MRMEPVDGLCTLEEIRLLKYRHIRCVDLKLWDEIADTLTEDATMDYGVTAYGKPCEVRGRPGILAFYRTRLGPTVLTAHAAGQPEITLDEPDAATAVWSVRDTILATEHRIMVTGAGFAHDRYRRGPDGHWRITRTSCQQTLEVMVSLDDLPTFRLESSPLPRLATRR
jgi:hypothetical protein